MLDAAHAEHDPKRAAQFYQEYLDRFDDAFMQEDFLAAHAGGVLGDWATWCGPCVNELRQLDRFSGKFLDNPQATLLTVSTYDTLAVVSEFARTKG